MDGLVYPLSSPDWPSEPNSNRADIPQSANSKPVQAIRVVRKMRGGSQAYLIEANNGKAYVVKFRENPQGSETLVNEFLAGAAHRVMGVKTPTLDFIEVTREFLKANPETKVKLGNREQRIAPGWALGSEYVARYVSGAVWDYLPSPLLARVHNRSDFTFALLIDKWLGASDARQAVFTRERTPTASLEQRRPFTAHMIDHGQHFGGKRWRFRDAPLLGLYSMDRGVYGDSGTLATYAISLDRFRIENLFEAFDQIPSEWLNGRGDEILSMLDALPRRRGRVVGMCEEALRIWDLRSRAARGKVG